MYSNIGIIYQKLAKEQKMKQKNSSNTSKKFAKHHHSEEYLLYISINEKNALCPSCNHPLVRHKIEFFITALRNYVIVNFQGLRQKQVISSGL
jgi:hypothetical protein